MTVFFACVLGLTHACADLAVLIGHAVSMVAVSKRFGRTTRTLGTASCGERCPHLGPHPERDEAESVAGDSVFLPKQ